MKASPLPGLAALLAVFSAVAMAPHGAAQDYVIRKSGQKVEGKIVGTSGTSLKIELAQGATTIPFADVQELKMEAPSEFDAAAAQLSRGDAKTAAAALEKINETFAGLNAPWLQRAAILLGDAKLAAGDKEGAKAAYEKFSRDYPSSTGLANLGMARLAIDSGDQAGAAKMLAPIVAQSTKAALPGPADGSSLCQAHYLMGRIKESEGDKSGALENYLKASALFPFDQNAVADATKRVDALRAENPGLIAP